MTYTLLIFLDTTEGASIFCAFSYEDSAFWLSGKIFPVGYILEGRDNTDKNHWENVYTTKPANEAERAAIGQLAQTLTELARARYELHRRTRHRLLSDLGVPGKTLNQKLTAWYDLNFAMLRAELRKIFKRDIPLAERNEWETFFAGHRAEHTACTAEIIRLETELNARVYALFDPTEAEI